MKILSTSQIRTLDAYTIEQEPVSSIDLMERASQSFVKLFIQKFPLQSVKEIHVFCGLGNNGGDGLAIAKILYQLKYPIRISVVRYSDNTSEDFETNFQRLLEILPVQNIHETIGIPSINSETIVIDALFGSGLNRAIEGLAGEVIEKINQSNAIVLSIDIPSGLLADAHTPFDNIISAQLTISFQVPKLAFFFPENYQYVGAWQTVAIGLNEEKLHSFETNYFTLDKENVQKLLKKREKFSHKGTYGKALLVVGSYGKMGAGILASRACMRAGVGLLTVFVPNYGYEIMQTSVPEVMVIPDNSKHFIHTYFEGLQNYDVIGMGCGMDTKRDTLIFLAKFLENHHKPLIIDADALNMIAEDTSLLAHVPKNSIFTPHPKEFERLLGKSENNFERLEKMKRFCQEQEVYMILKGAHSAIATPSGKTYFNTTGNAGMATAGSGDVLAGILTGLLAQGYSSEETCILGVFLHGLAGDLAKQDLGENAMIASDIIHYLPNAFLELER